MTLLILFLPLIASLLVLLAGNKLSRSAAITFSLLQLTATLFIWDMVKGDPTALSVRYAWVATPTIYFSLSIDGLSYLMLLLTNFITPLILLTTSSERVSSPRAFYSLILLMQFALNGVFMAMDGFLYYVFWELALIPIYFICLLWGGEHRLKVTFKFFVYTLAGSLFMLLGFVWLYQRAGNFEWSSLVNLSLTQSEQLWLFLAFFVAFAIKIPIVPFHTWQADTYREAPTAGTMLLSGIMLKMGTYSLLRWLLPLFPQGTAFWAPYVIVLCVIGVVYGSVIAIQQKDMKRLIAYSSLAHVGLLAAGVFSLTPVGFSGAVVQMLAHGVNVVALFFAAEIVFSRINSYSLADYGGIRSLAPKFTTVFMIAVLASVALPLTNGFVGEFMLLFGVYSYNTILGIFAGLTIILGAVYMLKMFQQTMLGESNARTLNFTDLTTPELLTWLPIIAVIFVFGIYPKPLMDMAQPALDSLLQLSLR